MNAARKLISSANFAQFGEIGWQTYRPSKVAIIQERYLICFDFEQSVLECRCVGSALQRIPQRLHEGMQRLAVSNAGLKLLRVMGLRIYGASLQDM